MQPAHDGVLQIEPTDQCNLRCNMCAPHKEGWAQIHDVVKGTMDMGLYEVIMDGLVADNCHFDHIIFQWLGDPSLHPALPKMLALAARKMEGRVGYLRVDTNAIRLPPRRMDQILSAVSEKVPLLLVFTLDAHTSQTYEKVKGVDALERVRSNIRYLIRQRALLQVPVNIQIQFVVQKGNEEEAGDFLAYWGDLLNCQGGEQWHDEVMFKRLSVGGGTTGQADADRLYEETIRRHGIVSGKRGRVAVQIWESRPWQHDDENTGPRDACPGLWLTPVIRHDGQLMMCCADLRGELQLGNLATEGFRSLWEGELATRHRLQHMAGRFEGICGECGGINWYETTSKMKASARRRAEALGINSGD